MAHKHLSEGALNLVAQRFKVLSDPLRLRLIHCLMKGERNVTALFTETGATQANVSRHLATLTRAGIVSRRKEGLNVYYSILDQSVLELCDIVCGGVEEHLRRQMDRILER